MNKARSRFSEQAIKALKGSTLYALEFSEDFHVTPEHLFLSLLDQSDCEASLLITSLEIDHKVVKTKLTNTFQKPTRSDTEITGKGINVVVSAELKQVLENAVSEAKADHLSYVNSRHLLLGILSLGSLSVSKLLEERGASRDKIHSIPQLAKEKHAKNPKLKYLILLIIVIIILGFMIYLLSGCM